MTDGQMPPEGDRVGSEVAADRLREFFASLIATALVQNDVGQADARATAVRLRDEVRSVPGSRPDRARLDGLWSQAIAKAETPQLMRHDLRVSLTLPQVCPLSVDDILATTPIEELETRVRLSASTG